MRDLFYGILVFIMLMGIYVVYENRDMVEKTGLKSVVSLIWNGTEQNR